MYILYRFLYYVFFFNDTATTEIYTLSLHDALPISRACTCTCGRYGRRWPRRSRSSRARSSPPGATAATTPAPRSEEHTSELQSRQYLVCRLLLEKKKSELHTIKYLVCRHPLEKYVQ